MSSLKVSETPAQAGRYEAGLQEDPGLSGVALGGHTGPPRGLDTHTPVTELSCESLSPNTETPGFTAITQTLQCIFSLPSGNEILSWYGFKFTIIQ